LFCWYFKRWNVFLAHYEYFVAKWEILGIVDEGVNSETRILLQFWDFHRLNADDAWALLLWVAWDSFEFESCGVICVILLPIMLAHVLFMLVMLI